MIDYDIVIIGGSLAGRYAALKATKQKAKVALIEPPTSSEFLYLDALSEVARRKQQLNQVSQFGLSFSPTDTTVTQCQISVTWEMAMLWAFGVESNIEAQLSPEFLAAQGVDVVFGIGQFQSEPYLAFSVDDRLMVGRSYLLATGSLPAVPDIEGLSKTGFFTLDNVWKSLKATTPPKNWAIIGGTPQSLEIAQTLTRLGCNATLITKHANILLHLDPEIAQLLQAQLEVEGVKVLTQAPVTQVLQIDDKKWLQAGDRAIESDEIIVATGQTPNIASLNLAAVGVKWHQNRLLVNSKLQTTNHRIYACGDVIGGYALTNLANYEASIALRNALFFPTAKINYQTVAWGISTQPAVAQVGLNQTQIKRLYHQDEVIVLRQYIKSLAVAQIKDETTGLCKLFTLQNGLILGGAVFGQEAGELINIIAMAINNKIKINRFTDLCPVFPSFAEILIQIAHDWQQQRLNNNTTWQELLEDFFQLRRDWKI